MNYFLADWYPITGGMQDMNYWAFGCMEITLEISCCKFPLPSQLETNWNENKKSLVEYLKNANNGIRGVVQYSNGIPAKYLSLQFGSREPIFKTNEFGEYYRILLPGTYQIKVMLNCDVVYQTSVQIPNNERLLIFNISLTQNIFNLSQFYTLNRYSIFCSKTVPKCVNYNADIVKHDIISLNNLSFIKPTGIFYTVYTLFILFCKIL